MAMVDGLAIGLSAISYQLSAISSQLSALSYQLSAYRLSAIGSQLPADSHRRNSPTHPPTQNRTPRRGAWSLRRVPKEARPDTA